MNRKVTDMLFHLYPEMAHTFDDIENNIYELAKNIYNAYVQRFIKKRFVTVPTEEFAIVRECHSWHEEDRIMNRINLNKVIEVFNKQTPTSINRMLRRYKMEKEQQSSNKETIQVRNRSNTVSTTGESPVTNSTVPSPLVLPNKPNKELEAINLV